MISPAPRLLITDLDNTLWDWFEAWFESFSALLDDLVKLSGVDRGTLEEQIRTVHQRRGTSEYSNLVREVPVLMDVAASRDPSEVFDSALHAQNSRRKKATRLYPKVDEGLRRLQDAGIRIAAYTESGAYWTEWRIRHTGLDGVIDVLYSAPDHDLAAGVSADDLRTGHYNESHYGLRYTEHRHVPQGVLKPNGAVLRQILAEQDCQPAQAVYLGDSLMKDVAMAQSVGVLDVHAEYGLAQDRAGYELLRRVTHWSDQDVEREKCLGGPDSEITPTLVCRDGFEQILPVFDVSLNSTR